jgi:hypothetical protein
MSTPKHTQRQITLGPELQDALTQQHARPVLESGPWIEAAAPVMDIDDALADVDARFEEMLSGESKSAVSERPQDYAHMRELFAQIAAGYMRPVRDFIIELQWGEAARAWIEICRPSIHSLRSSSAQMGIAGLAEALDELDVAIAEGCPAGSATIFGEPRMRILGAYAGLLEILPATFALGDAKNARETIIVHSLLTQVPDVGKVTIDKLYAAGLSSLETLFVARPDELAVATGIEPHLAERIVRRFRWYRSEVESSAVSDSHGPERDRLAALVDELEQLNIEFERVADSGGRDGARAKMELRKARTAIVSEVNVLLARMGEVKLVRDLERMPFDKKTVALAKHLQSMSDAPMSEDVTRVVAEPGVTETERKGR